MELKSKLKLINQSTNAFGFFFINEIGNSTGNSSVVLLIRSIKKFKKVLNIDPKHARNFFNVSILDYWVEVMDIKDADYSLAYLLDDGCIHHSLPVHKLLKFDNKQELDMFSVIKMLDCIIESNELMSVVATKTKVFLTLSSNEVQAEVSKALLVNFKTDYNMRNCQEKLILIKKNSSFASVSADIRNNIRMVVDL